MRRQLCDEHEMSRLVLGRNIMSRSCRHELCSGTMRSKGSALELAVIEELSGALALAIKGSSAPIAARDLLAAYLGDDAANRVSAGQVQRASVSRISAARPDGVK